MPTRKRLTHVRGRSVSLGKKGVSFFCLFFLGSPCIPQHQWFLFLFFSFHSRGWPCRRLPLFSRYFCHWHRGASFRFSVFCLFFVCGRIA
ncbi:hypothetical protein [Pandoravirus japonicus]|uniref:Uncharacterized protein n=1 Tax=Pandoravirus japonicus TaxID=2823154 RepID=A0A811BNN1_9VIRU|nr:hypothetical protein [Pandoravirus japonicus]